MTENMKKILEMISKEDHETVEKLKKANKEELIAWAAGKGVTLTEADFVKQEPAEEEGEVSLNEADAVAGGGDCYCFVGGGGTGPDGNHDKCGCVMFGEGYYTDGECRCICVAGGSGC